MLTLGAHHATQGGEDKTMPICRNIMYQPDLLYGKPGCNREKDCLTSPEGESELTESESHINMLKEGGSTLQTVLKPPLVPTEQSSSVVNMAVCLLVLVVCVISALTTYHGYAIIRMETWILCCLALSLVVFIGCVVLICQQPQTSRKVSFMVPLIPFLPILSIFVNVYLMVQLSGDTWIRFSIWMAVGFLIYFGYGMWHSVERQRRLQDSLSSRAKQEKKNKGPEKTSQC
ncbi:unnamed protein product [Oncorhynchus mykiss]|uniref:Cationic amino acid transporter C-terminal domain-containing protein n=1 Tax=Oncorhynchus mykiss TaxID=8022 RepID=A0A060XAE1_ONCMY|nr:unnamed protein product [Oncorhynchus mykiss]